MFGESCARKGFHCIFVSLPMAKKKIMRAEDITEGDILSLYEGVLPMVSYNPGELHLPNVLNKLLLKFIEYETFHYIVEDLEQDTSDRWNIYYENWSSQGKKVQSANLKDFSKIKLYSAATSTAEERFRIDVEYGYQSMLERMKKKHGEKQQYHYYRIESNNTPRIVVGFLRLKDSKHDNSFRDREIGILQKLAEHIFLVLRTVAKTLYRSPEVQYFEASSKMLSKINRDCHLSESESKLLPEILFGYSNNEIAKRNFISIETVKSHLK